MLPLAALLIPGPQDIEVAMIVRSHRAETYAAFHNHPDRYGFAQ